MGLRKNQNKLTDAEKARFVAAVKKMKADTAAAYNYDKFVTIHDAAFTGDVNTNPAHMGPSFFPWHRYFLLKFERDLQAADTALGGDGSLTLPYWDWTHDNANESNRQRGSIWRDTFMGGFGDPVSTGPFRDGQWAIVGGGPLVRAFGRTAIDGNAAPSLPTKGQIDAALDLDGFDCDPFDDSVTTRPALPSPGAPTLSGAAAGTLAAGTYRVCVTYVNVRGETRPSRPTSICLGAGCSPANAFKSITVAAPPARPSAIGYNVYVTQPDGAAGTETLHGAVRPMGAPATITAVAVGTGLPSVNTTGSFRNELEGWLAAVANHNRVHMWVAGSMASGTSPNDPIFFIHHCNIDRLWALWQFRHPGQNYPPVVPNVGIPGNRPHGLTDPMPPWTAAPELQRPIDMLNHQALGYTYDTDPVGAAINTAP